MNHRIITDIADYIFVSDAPEKVDAVFLPGGSHPEQPEYAAKAVPQGLCEMAYPVRRRQRQA